MANYHGWANKETQAVAMWITDNPKLYKSAIACKDYDEFVRRCHKRNVYETTGGVSLTDAKIRKKQLAAIWELFLDEVS